MVLSVVLLNACGGGGGGRDGGGSAAGISYTGITSQAVIDDSNAADFSTGAYMGGDMGSAIGGIAAIQTEDHKQISHPRALKLTQTLETAIVEVDVTAPSGVAVSGAIQQESDTIQGDCPGTPGRAVYTIEYNDVTGDFSGTFNFNSYCSEGVTISGSASFYGKVDPNTLEFLRFSITVANLTATLDRDSFSTKGNITYDFETSPVTANMDLLLKDNSTEKVYWVKYSMTLVEGPNYVEFEMSGTYYDPDYGYVVLSTEVPFVVHDGEDWPSECVLVVTGDTGVAGGSTKARLSALSSTTYQVVADTNGDGQYDWDSGILFWDE
jgi:hypothetical protein